MACFYRRSFCTLHKINFTIDSFRILEACRNVAEKNNLQDDWRIKEIFESSVDDIASLYHKTLYSKNVHHWGFKIVEKCRDDAVEYIDNNLGNGVDYVREHNLIPSLKMFF